MPTYRVFNGRRYVHYKSYPLSQRRHAYEVAKELRQRYNSLSRVAREKGRYTIYTLS